LAADSTQDRNQPASPKRRKDFRERGETGVSREISTALLMLTAAAAVALLGGGAAQGIGAAMREVFASVGQTTVIGGLEIGFSTGGRVLAPLFIVLLLVGVLAFVAQGAVTFSPKVLKPKLERLNPLKRAKHLLFSVRAVTELLKGLLKVGLLGALTVWFIIDHLPAILELNSSGLGSIGRFFGMSAVWLTGASAAALAGLAILDRFYQRHSLEKRMKMTRQEATEEHKEHEGDPLIKSRRRHRHRDLTLNRIMAEVPKADVVVTNPTHFAVAMRYDRQRDHGPRVIAKGQDRLALKIRSLARAHGVPIVEHKTLARGLYRMVRLGKIVRPELYQAVAEVYAFLYRRSRKGKA
jgi:flagellar biosynthetic protein FlhB